MTDFIVIRAPKNSANDESVMVVRLHVQAGEHVRAGQMLLEVETSKAVIEIDAPASGRFFPAVQVGDHVPVGRILGGVGQDSEHLAAALAAENVPSGEVSVALRTDGVRFSRTASEMIARHGLDPDSFDGQGLVTAAMVAAVLARAADGNSKPRSGPVRRGENGKVVLLGAGPGAWQLLSVLEHEHGSEVVGILDDDPLKLGRELNGVKVIGPLSMLTELAEQGRADSAICTTPTSIPFRAKAHQLTKAAGLRGANIIHPSALFDIDVAIGEGNFIGAFSYIGAGTVLGDYCFLSSRTTFEHHNTLGNGITTGPGVSTSGLVTVGNHVRFGGHILVEPNVTIGNDVVIASGMTVTADVEANSVLRQRVATR
ncbi:biotin/lipoyl-containing protein [Paramagnetospirillum magneticum]|uniref:Acetyltransferase n=1 Tax=Paramagnetospirillum magneticum (strain ATCC 700264 / AMB-1) TaxID=342108 RepID=Q2WB97_PARM1|nr:biotin/lipoyl-containing protein [Paramagnetospirillum magneticum]BAE48878.1 Acetyltransferase [Paramagnetospirillum magneticum AMB-1]